MPEAVPPHFHKQDRVAEEDLVPNGQVLSAPPTGPAPEGTEYVVSDGTNVRTYRMIQGVWRYFNWT